MNLAPGAVLFQDEDDPQDPPDDLVDLAGNPVTPVRLPLTRIAEQELTGHENSKEWKNNHLSCRHLGSQMVGARPERNTTESRRDSNCCSRLWPVLPFMALALRK